MSYLISLILLLLPSYLIRFSIAGIPTTLLEILIYLVCIIGIVKAWGTFRPIKWRIWVPIGLLFVGLIISTLIAPTKQTALGEIKGFFVDPILVFWLIYQFIKKDDVSKLYGALAISGLFVAAHTIGQKFLGHVTADGRVIGIFGYSPNYVALFLAPIAVLTASLLLTDYRLPLISNKYLRLAVVGSLFSLNLLAIYFSGSRGGLLAVGAGIIIYFMTRYWPIIRKKWSYLTVIIILLILSIVTAWSMFKPDFSVRPEDARASTSNNIRVLIWQTSLELGKNHPLLGVGLGNYQNAFNNLTFDRVNYAAYITPLALTPHNIFLMYWLSTGILGLFAFLWLIFEFYRNAVKKLSDQTVLISFAVISSILIYGLLEASTWKNDLSIIFWIFYALAFIL